MNLLSNGSHRPAKVLPGIAALAVVSVVVVAGVAGGLGGDDEVADTELSTPTTVAPSTVPSTTAPPVETDPPVTEPATTDLAMPYGLGMSGEDVLHIQERLDELGFFVGEPDGQFGPLTEKAVWAFEKLVLQTPRSEARGIVTNEMWQVMQRPMRIEPRRWAGKGQATTNHTEIYLPEQVVVFFVADEAVLISHISSGDGKEWREVVTVDPGEPRNPNGTEPIDIGLIGVSVTPGGVFDYDRFVVGRRQSALGGMYDPAYFNYGIAIHGAANVPLEPASHGCIRVPMSVGETFHQYVDKGDQVFVWDGVKEPEFYGDPPAPFDRVDPDWLASTTTTTLPPPSTQPAATQPPATQPAATQPPATQPAATQPPATQPPATQPAATQPAVTQPAATAAPGTTAAVGG